MKKGVLFFIIGFIVAASITTVALTIPSKDVSYDNTNSNSESTNVQGAIDELYDKVNSVVPIKQRLYLSTETNEYSHAYIRTEIGNYKKLKIYYSTKYIKNASWYMHTVSIGDTTAVNGIKSEDMEFDLTSYQPTNTITIMIWIKGNSNSDRKAYLDYELIG